MSLKQIIDLKSSLLFRLMLLYAATFSMLAFIGFTVFYYRIYSVTIERLDEELFEDARKLSELMTNTGLAAVSSKMLADAKNEDPSKEFHRVLNTNAEILTSSDMSAWGNMDTDRVVAEFKNSHADFIAQTVTLTKGDRARVITAAIGQSLLLQIGETLEETDQYLDIFRNLLTILVVTFIIVSPPVGWCLACRSLVGMREVTQAAEDITKGNYDRRVEVAGQFREVERLGATFNTMLDQIQNLLQSMQQINDNIAHDLRSPLARIRGIAEMTIVKEKHIQDYKDMAVSTIEECDTLIDMINTMLDITEIEAGVNEAKRERFNLNDLISGACDLFRPIADTKKINLQSNLPNTKACKKQRAAAIRCGPLMMMRLCLGLG